MYNERQYSWVKRKSKTFLPVRRYAKKLKSSRPMRMHFFLLLRFAWRRTPINLGNICHPRVGGRGVCWWPGETVLKACENIFHISLVGEKLVNLAWKLKVLHWWYLHGKVRQWSAKAGQGKIDFPNKSFLDAEVRVLNMIKNVDFTFPLPKISLNNNYVIYVH